ncbi:MAG: Precorrin-6B methylase 1 [Candidatus Methanohalarchaeum thermophilum]|uniref:Precorrin-6B methylase 1 n=1 Tax=Methanohalarchaeum thermophilum TaxID=1903181 RepID=A0A1Q6DVN3_METT1|nr:MAG: Precorrin-6B methylase 1 [Candidatus Methanohalarchaeum thermophilum]
MKIVGVGPAEGYLTEKAKDAIRSSKEIWGSDRSLNIVSDYISDTCEVNVINDYSSLDDLPEDATVLSTGDPMLSGLGYLDGEVINGISSLQLACAELGLSMLDVISVSIHGRDNEKERYDEISLELSRNKKVFLIPDPGFDLSDLIKVFKERGLNIRIYLLSRLGYEDQEIVVGDVSDPPRIDSELFSVFLVPEQFI